MTVSDNTHLECGEAMKAIAVVDSRHTERFEPANIERGSLQEARAAAEP